MTRRDGASRRSRTAMKELICERTFYKKNIYQTI